MNGGRITKVVVRIFAGLGNQLFQHAAALKYSDEPCHIIEASTRVRRPTIREAIAVKPEGLSRGQKWVLGDLLREWPLWHRAMARGARPLLGRLPLYDSIIQVPNDHEPYAAPPAVDSSKRLFLNGFFQHPDFYEPRLPTVCGELLERAPEQGRVGDGVVAVNFRRGDFIDEGWTLGLDYYRSALTMVNPDRQRPLWIVSDDTVFADLVADRLRTDGHDVLPNPDFGLSPAMNDFWALAFAERLVASNSTFAWWAAAVGDTLHGDDSHQVVVPSVFDTATVRLRRPHWQSAPSKTS